MDKECGHGIEWDIHCPDCELVSLNETIFHAGKALARAESRKIEVLKLIKEQDRILNEACEGLM